MEKRISCFRLAPQPNGQVVVQVMAKQPIFTFDPFANAISLNHDHGWQDATKDDIAPIMELIGGTFKAPQPQYQRQKHTVECRCGRVGNAVAECRHLLCRARDSARGQ